MMSRIPALKSLTSRLVGARAADPWLMAPMFPRMPERAVFEIDAKLGRSQPDDALMYLRLNVTRWRVDDFDALSWEEVLALELSNGRLPLLRRAADQACVGCDVNVPKGSPGHVVWWKGNEKRALTPSTWEEFFEGLVLKIENGEVAQDPLRIVAGLE